MIFWIKKKTPKFLNIPFSMYVLRHYSKSNQNNFINFSIRFKGLEKGSEYIYQILDAKKKKNSEFLEHILVEVCTL